MAHSHPVRSFPLAASVLGAAALLGACGSVRTTLPASVGPAPPLEATPVALTTRAAPGPAGPVTTTSGFKPAGERQPLGAGTLAASYPRVGVRPPKGVSPAPAGQTWAVVNVRFCAAAADPIAAALVDPVRFQVEVPGQGNVAPATDGPALTKAPLKPANPDVAPGTCLEGSIAYLVAGEGHIESVSYDTGAGLLRWAT